MEGMQSRTRYESGLVGYPEVFHRLKGVGKDDSLSCIVQLT